MKRKYQVSFKTRIDPLIALKAISLCNLESYLVLRSRSHNKIKIGLRIKYLKYKMVAHCPIIT